MYQFVIDYSPGAHGHFLEYVINRYVFKIDVNIDSIFQSSGACHPIELDQHYQENKMIRQDHFSPFEIPYPEETKKIVFVEHDPDLDFVLLMNVYYRCHPDSMSANDFNVKEIKHLHKSYMFFGSDAQLKNDWYGKLLERHFYNEDKKPKTNLPVLKFAYRSFFKLEDFLFEIKKTADFLDHTFIFDSSLVGLWQEFIKRNQGYQHWMQASYLLEQIFAGADCAIPDDWKIHAYLNLKISKIFALHDDPRLFGLEPYPNNTKQVHDIILDHIKNFDKQW